MRSRTRVSVSGIEQGLRFEVVETDMGHRCGYVEIPQHHPIFGVAYSQPAPHKQAGILKGEMIGKRGVLDVFTMDIDGVPRLGNLFDVHGSLTFSGPRNTMDDWWLGFDCCHSGDARDPELCSPAMKAIENRFGRDDGSVIRTNEYVESECRSLAQQINKHYPSVYAAAQEGEQQ